jgi:Reverse transcriptase (RNA-dependent DNA polymerase)
MLTETVLRRLDHLGELSQQGKRVNGLFRLMECPLLWHEAYARIYANDGAITKGVDQATLDGFSHERIAALIAQLKSGQYQFHPTRRVYVPKANGKRRSLGIPSGDDKLIQEVVRGLLERVYEPIFENISHGFRPNRSCHTALSGMADQWTAIKWLVMEISKVTSIANVLPYLQVLIIQVRLMVLV